MLHINDLTIRVAGRTLIERATAAIPDGARVGIVGRNGTGKTTLFKVLRGELSADDGSVMLPKGLRIGGVAQEAPSGPESLLEVVLKADVERSALMAEAETATDPHRIAEIQTRLIDIDAHSAPARAGRILSGLGFDAEAQQRACSSFSGGWRMRVALAAVLFSEPDLLLLDEPTNHLDLEGTLWLQDYLARYPRTVIVISHDRDLLDASVDHILHLNDARLTLYKGTYTSFDRQRREKLTLDLKHLKKQQDERARLEAFVARFKAKATKAKQAQSRVKRLEKMEPIAVTVDSDVLAFHIPAPDKPLAPPLIAFENASVGYDERVVLSRIGLSIAPDDRIGLLGSNGNGKSTLSKLIAGALKPMGGEMKRSHRMVVGFFTQHTLDTLHVDQTPYQHVRARMTGATEAQVRARTARIGFSGARADVVVAKLSGGEKARLAFGMAVFEAPHLLILDEPANHLDIDSRAALAEALAEYPGAVIIVSHDRHLLDACVDRLWLVKDGRVAEYEGDLDEYQRLLLGGKPTPVKAPKEARAAAKADRKVNETPIRAKLAATEKHMAALQRDIAKLDALLADPALFASDPAKGARYAKHHQDATAALAKTEGEWLELTAALEAT